MTLPTSPSLNAPIRSVEDVSGNPTLAAPRFHVPDGQYVHGQRLQYARRMGDNDLSYYLPSRADGANDILIHLEFKTSAWILTPQRLGLAWAILRLRHPTMAARVDMPPGKYREARFIYTPPTSPLDALSSALDATECFSSETTPKTLASFLYDTLNGPRKLSDTCLCKAFLVRETPASADPSSEALTHVCLAMGHFVTDGIGSHRLADELLTLLGSGGTSDAPERILPMSDTQLASLLENEWKIRWGPTSPGSIANGLDGYVLQRLRPLPRGTEERLAPSASRLQAIARRVENVNVQERLIGAHVFPKRNSRTRLGVSVILTFTPSQTTTILSTLKANGVGISDALFAVSNLAWIRTTQKYPLLVQLGKAHMKWEEQPMMMYSAINLRPMLGSDGDYESYLWVGVSYFNIVLPGFLPKSSSSDSDERETLSKTFFHRARRVKKQKQTYLASPFILSRARELNRERVERSIQFAIEDDAIAEGKPVPRPPPPQASSSSSSSSPSANSSHPTRKTPLLPPGPTPSLALFGITLLGDLSLIYNHKARHPALKTTRNTNHTRKNKGGMLMFSWSRDGEMKVSLGWDSQAFKEDVVEHFWEEFRAVFGEVFFGVFGGVGDVRWGEEGGEEYMRRNEKGVRDREVVSARM